MNNNVITFIITGTENNFHTRISQMKNLNKFGNPVLLHSTEQLESILKNMMGNFKFKLLIHGDEQVGDIFKGKYYIDEIKSFLNIESFDIISGKFIEKEVEFDYKNHKGFIRHNIDVINTLDFIDSLPIHTLNDVLIIKDSIDESKKILIKEPKFKFAIATALIDDEYNICKTLMVKTKESDFFIGKFNNTTNYSFDEPIILFSQYDKMGMVEASILSNDVILRQNPELLFLGGVCGGRKGKVHIYDVIIPHLIIDVITGKFESNLKTKRDTYKPYGYFCEPNERLINHLKTHVNEPEFKTILFNSIPESNSQEFKRAREIINKHHFKIHTEVMGCGPFVLKKDGFLEEKANEMNEKIIAYEMESYGFMRACLKNHKLSLVVKSVMDYTDSNKSDKKPDILPVEIDDDNIPTGENIKKMASYISFITIKALIPYLDDFLSNHKE